MRFRTTQRAEILFLISLADLEQLLLPVNKTVETRG
nr:MAG TPA: hypothetical protein [Caudoviricetes sp.]